MAAEIQAGKAICDTFGLTDLLDVPIDLEVELARSFVAMQSLLRLEPGSLIPMKTRARGEAEMLAGSVSVATGDVVVAQNSIGVRLKSFERRNREHLPESPLGTEGGLGQADLLAEVCVPVRVSLGTLRLPFREIAGMSVGQVVSLGKPPEAPVTVIVSNRVFAQGRLLVIDGEYTVQVERLAPFAAAPPPALASAAETAGMPAKNDGVVQERAAEAFDYSRGESVSNAELEAVKSIHETLAKRLGQELSRHLGSRIGAKLLGAEQASCADFLNELPTPRFIALLDVQPYSAVAALEISYSLLFAFIELLLGGTAEEGVDLTREMTAIERQLLGDVFQIIERSLSAEWSSLAEADFRFRAIPADARLSGGMTEYEAVVAVRIELTAGGQTGTLNLAVPAALVKQVIVKSAERQTASAGPPEGNAERPRELCRTIRVAVDAELDGQMISLRDLLDLKAGDVLDLGQPFDVPMQCSVGGVRKFLGHILSAEAGKAFQIDAMREGLSGY